MANIELVIKISEEYYNAIKEIPDNLCDIYELVIKHGVLLTDEFEPLESEDTE